MPPKPTDDSELAAKRKKHADYMREYHRRYPRMNDTTDYSMYQPNTIGITTGSPTAGSNCPGYIPYPAIQFVCPWCGERHNPQYFTVMSSGGTNGEIRISNAGSS